MTGVATNPFEGIRRSPPRTRTVTMTPEQILALVTRPTSTSRKRSA